MAKILLKSILVILSLMILAFYIFIYPRLEVISAYAAKTACSSIYVSHRNLDDILSQDLAASPLNLANVQMDNDRLSAKANVYGMQEKEAIYRKGFGCILLDDQDDYQIKYPKENPAPNINNSTFSTSSKYNQLANEAIEYLFEPKNMTQALVVIKRDSIILEKYNTNISADTPLLGWSMTKSITSALIGLAIQDGLLELEEKNLFKEWANDERANITLNDLLQMNSGLEWTEDYTSISDATRMLYIDENIIPALLDAPKENKQWEYSSGTTNLLMGLLREKINNDDAYWKYPKNKLFDPTGMTSAIIETDESGNFIGSSFGYATARDWAKFGNLYLNHGRLMSGAQLIDSSYVSYSAKAVNKKTPQYGAQWWLNVDHNAFKNAPEDLYAANGYQGQHVWIIPSLELVVVRIGLRAAFEKDQFLKLLLQDLSFI